MAGSISNLKGLFLDTRTRVIIILTFVLLIGGILAAVFSLRSRVPGPESGAEVTRVPGRIKSIPGVLDPSEQYAKLLEQANIERAEQAGQTGQSALPTPIRSRLIGEGEVVEGQGVGFGTLARQVRNPGQFKDFGLLELLLGQSRGPQTGSGYGVLARDASSSEVLAPVGRGYENLGYSVNDLLVKNMYGDKLSQLDLGPRSLVSETGLSAAQQRELDALRATAALTAAERERLARLERELAEAREAARLAQLEKERLEQAASQQIETLDEPLTDASEVPGLPTIAAPTSLTAPSSGIDIDKILQRQSEQLSAQQRQQRIQQIQSGMEGQARQLFDEWQPTDQVFVQGQEQQTGKELSAQEKAAEGIAGVGAGEPIAKAGDVIFAVLETSINSDEPGPVMATIVQGKFKGAKLIGTFPQASPNAEKLVIQFNTMSIDGVPQSIPVNAVAIDPNTARTALASDVDHHYLERYGSLFASSFLEGIGSAVGSSGAEITKQPDGGSFVQAPDRKIGEEIVVGLGTVGQKFGEQLGPKFQRPATIKVYSGVGLGILFLADVQAVK